MLALSVHTALMLTVLVGVAVRRRWRATLAFPLYLLVGCAHKLAQSIGFTDPDDWLPWLLIGVAQNILALCVAVEIGGRVFHRDLPGGRTYTGRVVLLVLAVGFVAALAWGRQLSSATTDRDLYFLLVEGGRRVTLTAATVFTLLGLAIVSYFDWPLDPYHRDIALGFWLYECVYLVAAPWPSGNEWASPQVWPVWVYSAVLLWWCRATWKPVDALGLRHKDRVLVFPWQVSR